LHNPIPKLKTTILMGFKRYMLSCVLCPQDVVGCGVAPDELQ
jgi:hypothetical protein